MHVTGAGDRAPEGKTGEGRGARLARRRRMKPRARQTLRAGDSSSPRWDSGNWGTAPDLSGAGDMNVTDFKSNRNLTDLKQWRGRSFNFKMGIFAIGGQELAVIPLG